MDIISRMNGKVFHKIAETEKYIFYDKKIYSKTQWRTLKPRHTQHCHASNKKYNFKAPFTQITPRYKMEYPITLYKVQEFTEKYNLKFWV